MTDELRIAPKDRRTTILVVLAMFIAPGLVGASIPYGSISSLVSGALFVGLVAYFRWRAGAGRRSDAASFFLAGFLVLPILIVWFVVVWRGLDNGSDNAVLDLMSNLQVGGSLRNCPHAGDICGVVWWVFTLVMIGLALALEAVLTLFLTD